MHISYKHYRFVTGIISPLIVLWLLVRALRKKEEWARLGERFGRASKPRPKSDLCWIHAASVGEANAILMLLDAMQQRFPKCSLLVTTGTVTSAQLMQKRLPKNVIHQYAPVDTPKAAFRFINHWRPDVAFFVESELWPNLIAMADEFKTLLGIINGRMSERSAKGWQKHPELISFMLSRMAIVFAQTNLDGERFALLGARHVEALGNLKFDAKKLPCDEAELLRLKNALSDRVLWMAASTHTGEEKMIAEAHNLLVATKPNLLTIIVPRHPRRGAEIAQTISSYGKTALRSKQDVITADTKFYIADTIGELGLFYRLADIVFMGGSLVRHGGQNPLEPARLSCAILTGPYMHNFVEIYGQMAGAQACLRIENAAQLASTVHQLFQKPDDKDALQRRARLWVEGQSGATDRLLQALDHVFSLPKRPA